MDFGNYYINKLREEYIDSIMTNDKIANFDEAKILVETKGNNEDYVQLIEYQRYYIVKSSWRIQGRFDNLGKAKRLYKSLVNELLAEF